MTVVHVCKYYYDSSVHRSLIGNLSHLHNQKVKILVGTHESTDEKKIDIFYCKYSPLLRFFLLIRTLRVFFFSLRKSIFKDAKLVFCHTLVVDGALGYLAKIFFNTPYVVQVRNTDINFYYKRFPFYRPLFNLILKNASSVGFVSMANMHSFYAMKGVPRSSVKAQLWPNGINDFWFKKCKQRPLGLEIENKRLEFLFVGRFNENKNLRNVASAHELILSLGYDVSITYVGGTAEGFEICTGRRVSDLKNVTVIERLEMELLSDVYSSSLCLVVPSFFETFGLVYLESLSRNCPVICSTGQGIYGLFPECKSIRFVSPNSIESISEQMIFFIKNELSAVDFPNLENFSWNSISNAIYSDLQRFL